MIPSRSPSRSATITTPSKTKTFGKFFRRFSHFSTTNSNGGEQKNREPVRYPSPRPQKFPSHQLPLLDLTSFFGPPCINERRLWTIYESETDACTVKVIRLVRRPPVERPRSRSCLKASTSKGVPTQVQSSTSPQPTSYISSSPLNSIPLQRVSSNSNAWALAMATPKPTSLTSAVKLNANIKTTPTTSSRGTRAKENVEVSAIRRRQRRNNRDDLFAGCHL